MRGILILCTQKKRTFQEDLSQQQQYYSGQGRWDHREPTGFCKLGANFCYHQTCFSTLVGWGMKKTWARAGRKYEILSPKVSSQHKWETSKIIRLDTFWCYFYFQTLKVHLKFHQETGYLSWNHPTDLWPKHLPTEIIKLSSHYSSTVHCLMMYCCCT